MSIAKTTLLDHIRSRAGVLGLPLSTLCKQAKISRQTLYAMGQPGKLPDLYTLIELAHVLRLHPSDLLEVAMRQAKRPGTGPGKPMLRMDKSAFVGDVTYGDGCAVAPDQLLTKTWEIQNTGNVLWCGRWLRCMDDDLVVMHRTVNGPQQVSVCGTLLPSVRQIRIPDTQPGETVQLSVDFTTPSVPGTYLSYWKSTFADGTLCFPESLGLSVRLRVVSLCEMPWQPVASNVFDTP